MAKHLLLLVLALNALTQVGSFCGQTYRRANQSAKSVASNLMQLTAADSDGRQIPPRSSCPHLCSDLVQEPFQAAYIGGQVQRWQMDRYNSTLCNPQYGESLISVFDASFGLPIEAWPNKGITWDKISSTMTLQPSKLEDVGDHSVIVEVKSHERPEMSCFFSLQYSVKLNTEEYQPRVVRRQLRGARRPPPVTPLPACDCTATTNAVTPFMSATSLLSPINGASKSLTISIRDTVSLACGDSTGLTYCGVRQVVFYDSLGVVAPMPYRELTWNPVTNVLTLNPTATISSYEIFAYVEFASYPDVFIEGSIFVSVFDANSAPCLLPTTGMNLLNTNVVAYQTSFYGGLATSSNQACDGIQLTQNYKDLVHPLCGPTDYWQAQFPQQTLITSALVINRIDCCANRITTWNLQIAIDPTSYTNCNFGTLTSGGWWNVMDRLCSGMYFRISATQCINFYEISLFSYTAVQMRALSAASSSSLTNIANALSKIVITASWTLSTYCQGPIYPNPGVVIDPATLSSSSWFKITFSDYVRVKGVVLTGVGGTSSPQVNVNVYVDSTLCGLIPDFSQYAEIGCANKVGHRVTLSQVGGSSLSFCGFGILTDCDCTTSYFSSFIWAFGSWAQTIWTSTKTNTITVKAFVNQPPLEVIVFKEQKDIVTSSCGLGTCGSNKISYSLTDGSPVPWPYNGLSLSTDTPIAEGKDTLTVTASDELAGVYSILVRLELISYPLIYYETTFTWKIIPCVCSNPIGGLNLLDTASQAKQTTFVPDYNTNSNVGCNKVLIPDSTFSQVVAAVTPDRSWSVKLQNQAQIQTVLFVGDLNSKFEDYSLTFGNDPNPFLNEVCTNKMTSEGWWECSSLLTGFLFAVTSVSSRVEFTEVMIYNQKAIQLKAYLVAYANSQLGYLPATAVSNIVTVNTGSTSCYCSETQTNPYFEFYLNAVTRISGVVALPSNNPLWTGFQTDVEVWVSDPSGSKQCGLFSDYNEYSEVKCNQAMGNKVTLKKSSFTSLRFCGVGILSDCNCSLTSFDPKLMPLYTKKSPSEQSLNYTVSGPPQTITFTSNDTVSLVCGQADGQTFCGPRTVTVTNKLNGQVASFFKVNAASITLQTDNETDTGDHTVIVSIQLDKYPTAKFEFEVSVKIVGNAPCLNTKLELVDPVLPLAYFIKLAHWIDDPQTLTVPTVTDSVSKSSKVVNACGPIVYSLYDAPDQAVAFDKNSLSLEFQTRNSDGVVSGVRQFTVVASLQMYATVKPVIFTYTYDITPCYSQVVPKQNVVSVVIVALDALKEEKLPGFSATPECGYKPISYKVSGALDVVSSYPTTKNNQIGLQSMVNVERDVVVLITPEYSETVRGQITLVSPLTVNVQVKTSSRFEVKIQKNSTNDTRTVWIESITSRGLTTILFRDELVIAQNMKNITGKQIKLSYRLASDNFDEVTQPWNWTVQNFTSKALVIQLNFTSPLKVSKYIMLDELQVLFKDPSYFISSVTKTAIMEPQTVILHEIPKQFASESAKKLAEATAQVIDAAQYGTIVGILIAQLAGKQVIKRIFSFFMMTQLVLMTEYFEGIMIPANLQIVLKSIKDIINMEALPKEKIKTWLFNQGQEVQANLSKFSIENSMSLVGIFLGIGGGLALIILLLYFASKKIPMVHLIIVKMKDALFFGTIIVSIQTVYLSVVYSGTLSIKGYALGQSSATNLAIGILLLLAAIIYLIVVQAMLTKMTKNKLEEPKRLMMYGALYKNLTLTKESLKWPGIFYARRLAVGVVTAVIPGFTFQSHICMYLTIMVGAYVIGTRPISNRTDQRVEGINEVTLLVLYMIEIAFCGVVVGDQAEEVRVIFGWVFNAVYAGSLVVNLGFLVYNEVYLVIRKKIQQKIWFKRVKLMGKDPIEILENRKIAEQSEKERQKAARRAQQRQERLAEQEPRRGAFDIPQDYENSDYENPQPQAKKKGSNSVSIHVPKDDQLRLEVDNRTLGEQQPGQKRKPDSKVTGREFEEAKLEQHNRNAQCQLEEMQVRETLSEKKSKLMAFQQRLRRMTFDATKEEEWEY